MSTIRPTRAEITDRFPVLGFTVNTGGNPLFEVVLTTKPELTGAEQRSGRTNQNFFSSRALGPLRADRGEAVWLVPPEVLKRFAGAEKLFYGLATYADASRNQAEVARTPTPDSPWVNLRGFTGRGSRRMMLSPVTARGRSTGGNGYSKEEPGALEWAGDAARPGTEPVTRPPISVAPDSSAPPPPATTAPAPGPTAPSSQAAAFDYDDGFGPMSPVATNGEAGADEGIDFPIPDDDANLVSMGLAWAQSVQPEYSGAASFIEAKHFHRPREPRTIDRIVIHITAGQGQAENTARYFQNPTRWLRIDVEDGEPVMEIENGKCKRFRNTRRGKARMHECVNGRTQSTNGYLEGLAAVPVSAHYAVGQDGLIIQMVRHEDVAYHASNANERSIGIEHNARKPRTFNNQDAGLPPNETQYCASAALVSWLCEQFGIPKDREHIVGHKEIDTVTDHDCPSAMWDWDYFMGLVTSGTCYPRSAAPAATSAQSLATRASRGVRSLSSDILYNVQLVPQPNKLACWAASMAMLVGFRRTQSIPAETLAQEVGRDLRTSYSWDMLEAVKNHFGFQDIRLPDNASLYYPPEQWHRWLSDYGPLWVTTIGAPSHAIIVHGISGDLTPGGTTVHILNPWDINTSFDADAVDFNPFNQGTAYSRPFDQFASEFANLDLDNYGRWRVLYLPEGGTPTQASGLASASTTWQPQGMRRNVGRAPQASRGMNGVPLRTPRGSTTRAAAATLGRGSVTARPLEVVQLDYAPDSSAAALSMQQDFQNRYQQWMAGVTNTGFYPHSAICQLVRDDGGAGTGFYIAPDRILTAAHVVEGANSLTVIPGKNGGTQLDGPFGHFTVPASSWVIHPRRSSANHDFDLAVLMVSTPPPGGQYFDILEELRQSLPSAIIVCGYSAQSSDPSVTAAIDPDRQHMDGDYIRALTDETFQYNLQTLAGASGSPVYYAWSRDDAERQVCVIELHMVGVHVSAFSGTLNSGCRLTDAKIAWINSVGRAVSAGTQSLGRSPRSMNAPSMGQSANRSRRAITPARAKSLAGQSANELALKEADYSDDMVQTPDAPRVDPLATATATNEEIYRIVREVALADSGEDLYSAVSTFPGFLENGARNFGLAFGLVLFTQESGRLGRVLELMRKRDPQTFASIVGPNDQELIAVTNAATPSQRLQPVGGEPLWSDGWAARFKQLGAIEAFQAAQNEEAIEGQFRPMLALAASLGLNTDRALALSYDRVVTGGLGGGLRWVVQAVGPLRTSAQRAHALAMLGQADVTAFHRSPGLPTTGIFTHETHAALVGALRRQGKATLPGAEELIARLIAAAAGPARARLLRLRDSAKLQDIHYQLD